MSEIITCVLAVLIYGTETWTLTQPEWKRLDSFHNTMSTTDPSHQMAGIRYQWWSLTSNRSPSSFIYRPQTKAWTVRTRCQTRRRCSSKPDPPDLLQSSRRCPTITRLEACSRSTSHYMDASDPSGHGNTGDWCSRAGRRQIVLATNRNGGMLRLIAPCHDDDDEWINNCLSYRRQSPKTATVAENGDCRPIQWLSPKTASVAENGAPTIVASVNRA